MPGPFSTSKPAFKAPTPASSTAPTSLRKQSVSSSANKLLKLPSLKGLNPQEQLNVLRGLQQPLPPRERALAPLPPRERQQLLKQEDALKGELRRLK